MRVNELFEVSANPDYLRAAERSLGQAIATQRTFGKSPEEKAAARRTELKREKGMQGYGRRHRAANPEMYPEIKPRPAAKLRDPSTEYSDDYSVWSAGRRDTMEQGVAEGSEQHVPPVLYHATYKPRLKSIKLKGLGAGGKRNWEDSQRGVVYLALDPDVAESYAETSDMVPDEWLDQIVMLKISTVGLDSNKFGIDSNVQDNAGDTIEYHGVIPVSNISLYKSGVAENFADGRNPQDKGDSVRHGIPKGATMAELEKASHAKGRKGQLARWQLNMRRGKKK